MPGTKVLSTALDISRSLPRGLLSTLSRSTTVADSPEVPSRSVSTDTLGQQPEQNVDPEFMLPKISSLVVILLSSALLQISFFIIVSSSSAYAEHLGGTATFSGLVIGIPTVFAGLTLLPLAKFDGNTYKFPLHFACGCAMLGQILYALAYKANFLYLILIGRIVSGGGFTFWMYSKRYCSDARIVGVRRRTTLAGWLVVGQATGFSLGPFVGGLLYKIGFNNSVFNGYTSPAWIMALSWAIFWAFAAYVFEDVPKEPSSSQEVELTAVQVPTRAQQAPMTSKDPTEPTQSRTATVDSESAVANPPSSGRMSAAQWGVTATMCWFAMTCFFILGAWEANIPVFTSSASPLNPFHFTPFAAGNLIALGGACTFPFLFVNVFIARRIQDRNTLAVGTALGAAGLFIAIAILRTKTVNYGSLFICWFLVALGFNLASTVTLSLLSKQLPNEWNTRISTIIQCSNYTGRVTGSVWGGAGVKVGMVSYIGLQVGIVGIGVIMFSTLWRDLKAKTG